jgi:hypothetical protein
MEFALAILAIAFLARGNSRERGETPPTQPPQQTSEDGKNTLELVTKNVPKLIGAGKALYASVSTLVGLVGAAIVPILWVVEAVAFFILDKLMQPELTWRRFREAALRGGTNSLPNRRARMFEISVVEKMIADGLLPRERVIILPKTTYVLGQAVEVPGYDGPGWVRHEWRDPMYDVVQNELNLLGDFVTWVPAVAGGSPPKFRDAVYDWLTFFRDASKSLSDEEREKAKQVRQVSVAYGAGYALGVAVAISVADALPSQLEPPELGPLGPSPIGGCDVGIGGGTPMDALAFARMHGIAAGVASVIPYAFGFGGQDRFSWVGGKSAAAQRIAQLTGGKADGTKITWAHLDKSVTVNLEKES